MGMCVMHGVAFMPHMKAIAKKPEPKAKRGHGKQTQINKTKKKRSKELKRGD